ncbi:bifunctional alpha/beta hydrolase/OsmC family protein [Marinobacterium arenosum]|uniref:bifunctional alpha/beta hydrolase/OsmC family protein n=1 Tax=Marinobacterium arenosum TaxID=2862496 RepID=UPI001C97822A|nr:bifunctional alpha/beta hydrolase/OsmC family protein [Marinobacterium arenosum]MBY4678267.1 alpha/beta fold hydrolase [Marinobacterium arenosum]
MTARLRVEFDNGDNRLAGLLESPAHEIRGYALFAHCFTCGKDIAAASRIARALVAQGIAVMRFDFTGLGNSDGDFANTNFSSNVQDLVAAADFLRQRYQAPALLIGHSLGGAAALQAAFQVPEAVAVATIGAPANAGHVAKQFGCDIKRIEAEGEAQVMLAGRPFTIKKQFLDDIAAHDSSRLAALKKALLVMHSPVDTVVSINEAQAIYQAAKHPKSFISLDSADHLLTDKADSEYVAGCIAAWASRYLPDYSFSRPQQNELHTGHVRVEERNHQFTRNVFSDSHFWLADEPTQVGGLNLGPDPYEHLLAALGACTSMTIRMYANHKKLPLEDVSVELRHARHYNEDCEHCEDEQQRLELLERQVRLRGELTDEQRQRLLQIADRCPVHKTLTGALRITTVEK